MARNCALCGKTSQIVWQRSRLRAGKYNPTAKKRQYPNLQRVRLVSGEKVLACTRCIKTMGKRK